MKYMSFVKMGLGFCAFLLAFFVFHTSNVQAATCTFASTEATNNFNLAANWSCGHAPVTGDDAFVPSGTSTTLTASSTFDTLTATGTVNAAAFNLTVSATTTVLTGGVVTSTSGTLTLTGAVTSTGAIGSSQGNIFLGTYISNNGTFDVGAGNTTATGAFYVLAPGGVLNNGSGRLELRGPLSSSGGPSFGTYNAQSGTIVFSPGSQTTNQGLVFNNVIFTGTGLNVANFSGSSTVLGTLTGNGGSFSVATNDLTVIGSTTLLSGATVTSTSGTLTFNGTVTSTGSIGSVSGNMLFSSTLQNNGTLNIASGTATSTGNLTNAGTINGNTGTLSILADFTNSGSGAFNPQSGTVRVSGIANQSLPGGVYGNTYNNFESLKTSGTVSFAGNVTIGGTTTLHGGETLSALANNLQFISTLAIPAATTVTSTSGTLIFSGAVTSTGSIGSSSGNMLFGSTLQNNGTLDIGASAFATSTGNATSTGTIHNGSGTLVFLGNFNNTGTYQAQSGTAKFAGSSLQTLSGNGISFATLVLANTSGGVTTGVNVSSTSFTLSSGTLNLSGNRFAATSSFSNTGGYINVNSGTLVGALSTSDFTNASGTAVTSLTNPGSMYVTITDPSRNLSATSTDSFSFTVLGNSASGGDSETLTLVETSAASGVFRNASAVTLKYSGVATPGSTEFEINGTGSASYTYTDAYDASDTTSTSVTLTFAGASAGSSSSGSSSGGGGGGAGSSQALAPLVTTYQTLVTNLATLGIPVHALVKLPDDGNLSTQEDSAVYYIGTDGKRHAFSNSKVYFTWYQDFSQVQVVNLSQLSSIPLGSNVTYKPGVRMVKFTTDPKVYAVDKGGVLRWIASEDLAIALYGNNWNMMIDDVSDAFYVNYTFGNNINSTADFSVSGVSATVYPD